MLIDSKNIQSVKFAVVVMSVLGKGRGGGSDKMLEISENIPLGNFQGNACIGSGVPQKVVIVRKVFFGGVTRQISCWKVGGGSFKMLKFIKKPLGLL